MINLNPAQKRALSIAMLGIAAVLSWRAWDAWQVFEMKAAAQNRETSAIMDYTRRHEALKAIEKKFDSDYPAEAMFSDWASYFAYLDFPSTGLEVDVDNLTLGIAEIPPNEPGGGLGLRRACIGGAAGADLVVKAKTYAALLSGLDKLIRRPQITASAVTIAGDRLTPEARISTFCLLFRKNSAG